MAGRGRGRGRGTTMSAIADALGVGRGDLVGLGIQQPPPIYPERHFKPLPLPEDEKRKEDVAYMQKFRHLCRKQPYYIRKPSDKKGIDRYTDRYREASLITDNTIGWTPNWSKLPNELRIKVRDRRPGGAASTTVFRPNLAANRKRKTAAANGAEEAKKTLEMLEAKEKEDGDDDEPEEDDYSEEEDDGGSDEAADYFESHFDNGEDYGFDDDDNLDEGAMDF